MSDRLGRTRRLQICAFCTAVIALVSFALAPRAPAQPTARVPRIGVLGVGDDQSRVTSRWMGFLEELRALGHVEGRNVLIDWRFAGGDRQRRPGLARELARLRVDVVVTTGPSETLAAKQALPTHPS